MNKKGIIHSLILLISMIGTQAQAQLKQDYIYNQFLISYKEDGATNKLPALKQQLQAKAQKRLQNTTVELWEAQFPLSIDGKIIADSKELSAHFAKDEDIHIEPNFIYRIEEIIPNEPSFNQLWGMKNTGQFGGTPGVDIAATEAWEVATSSPSMKVAVIDTGIDWKHEDLVDNIWQNLGEDSDGDGQVLEWNGSTWIFDPGDENGIDDDNNGYADDFVGWDFANDDNDPFDDHTHGTHVAGTIGATGNNGIGVVGVTWNVQMAALKFMKANGSGSNSDAIAAVRYAVNNGFHLSNNSWGGGAYSAFLKNEIQSAATQGQLFIAAAGNYSINVDSTTFYPASYDVDNIIVVAATDDNDELSYFSNYGQTSVDLAAPGQNIYSTVPGNGYASYNGTSMAAPMVAGAVALVWEANPAATHQSIKSLILNTVDATAAMDGKSVSGGRLNLLNAINEIPMITPDPNFTFTVNGLAVDFKPVLLAPGLNYSWRFGDWTFGNTPQPTHLYPFTADFDACLIVGNGVDSLMMCQTIVLGASSKQCYSNKFTNSDIGTTNARADRWLQEGDYLVGGGRFNMETGLIESIRKYVGYQGNVVSYIRTRSGQLFGLLMDNYSGNFALLRLANDGAVLWSKEYYSTGQDQDMRFIPGNSDTLRITGLHGLGSDKVAILQIDTLGNPISTRAWNYGSDDEIGTYCQIADGEGYTKAVWDFPKGFHLSHFDKDGNLVWNKQYNYSAAEIHPYSLIKTIDGGYAVTCQEYGTTGTYYIVKINADLSFAWAKKHFLAAGSEYAETYVKEDDFGNLYLYGDPGFDDKRTNYIAKTTATGDLIWANLLEHYNGDLVRGVGNLAFHDDDLVFYGPLADLAPFGGYYQFALRADTSLNVCAQATPVAVTPVTFTSTNYTPTTNTINYTVNALSVVGDILNFYISELCTPCEDCDAIASFNHPEQDNCGETTIDFTNTSILANNYSWLVDGVLLGSDLDFSYTFPSPGTYQVTLTAFSSDCSSSFSKAIYINGSAADLELGPDLDFCGDSILIDPNLPGMVTYIWDLNGTLVGTNPTLYAQVPGIYHLTVWDTCALVATDSLTVYYQTGCVWPGDYNNDGIVDQMDLFPAGLAFGSSGPVRPDATTNWVGQSCPDWTDSQADGTNYKYIDGTGNGLIDFDDDQPILLNYGKTHGGQLPLILPSNMLDINLKMNLEGISTASGAVLMETSIALEHPLNLDIEIYGIAFTYNYFGNQTDSDFSTNTIGSIGTDLISIVKDIPGERIDIALVGINQTDRIANGALATMITEINLPTDLPKYFLSNITNVRAILADGTEIPIGSSSSSQVFQGQNTEIGILSTTATMVLNLRQDPYSCGSTADVKTTVLGGTAPYTYLWSDGQSTATALQLPVGYHQLSLTDATGRILVGDIEVVTKSDFEINTSSYPASLGNTDGTATVIAQNTSENYNYAYRWSNDALQVPTITNLAAGNYQVSVSNGQGCRKIAQIEVLETTATAIENPRAIAALKLFPNPAKQSITLIPSTTLTENTRLQLINSLGQKITTSHQQNSNSILLDVQNLPTGIYFIELRDGERSFIGKFQKAE